MPLAAFERVIRVNLIGTFNMLRLAAAAHDARSEPLDGGERGVIVNTASVAAYDGQVGQAAYAASKGGIVSLTLPAARELARFGVRVLTIAPGLFATPLVDELAGGGAADLADRSRSRRGSAGPRNSPRWCVAIIENPFLNGETIRLDGALRMAPR